MVSQWFDESDFQRWLDENPELNEQITELKTRWMYEFDTIENRKIMNAQFKELVETYISKKRDEKIDSILEGYLILEINPLFQILYYLIVLRIQNIGSNLLVV